MSVYYTADDLIDSVKRRISIPTSQNTFTDEDILSFADEELMLAVVPAVLSLHEDYLLFKEDVVLVAEQSDYVIPHRSVGNKLYDLQLLDNNGVLFPLTRTTAAEQPHYGTISINQYSYYVMNNRITLVPQVGSSVSGSLRFIYYIRPGALVKLENVAVITAIDRGTGVINVNDIPSEFNVSLNYDLYKAKSPHNVLDIDLSITAFSTVLNTITMDPDDIPSTLEVGDHIAQSQEAAIPQIPSDLHVYLAQKTAERILESQGDLEGLKLAQSKSSEMEVRAGNLIDNRVQEAPVKLVNNTGLLKSGLFRRRG